MASPPGSAGTDRLLRAVTALAELPLARACGLGPALAEDVTALAAGRTPRLRVALSGPEPAVRPLAAALHRALPSDAVRLDARPVDGHLLLLVVPDERTPPPAGPGGPEPDGPEPGLSELLVRPGAPRASVVVVAEDDWEGLGLDSVAGWHGDRLWSWPKPWHTVSVRAVVPRWALTRPQRAGLDVLLREELTPALDGRHALTAELTRIRLTRALRLLDATAQDVTAQDATAQDATAQDATAQDATAQDATAQDMTAQDATAQEAAAQEATADRSAAVAPADAWLRVQARAGGPPARRLSRLLDGRPGSPFGGTAQGTAEAAGRDGRDDARDDARDGRDGEVA